MKKLLIIFVTFFLCACNDPAEENHLSKENNYNSLKSDSSVNESLTSENKREEDIKIDELNPERDLVEEGFQAFEIVVGVERLNVRKSADQESEKLGQALLDEKYTVSEIQTIDQSDWYKINYNGQDAWIAGWYTYQVKAPIIKVYKERNINSNFLGYLDKNKMSDTNKNINGIETSDEKLLFWREIEFNGLIGYCYFDEHEELVFDEFIDLINDDDIYTVETKDKSIKYLLDSTNSQMLLFINEKSIYIGGGLKQIVFEDASLLPPEPSLRHYYTLFSSGNRLRSTENRVYVINGQLANRKYELSIGNYEVEEYEIKDASLSPVIKYEITGISRDDVTYIYTSMDEDDWVNTGYILTLDELNQKKCQEILVYLNEVTYKKFYTFEVNGETHYTKEGFKQVPKQTKIVLGNEEHIIPGDINFAWFTNYNGQYFEYKVDDQKYLYNIELKSSFEMDKVFYDMDLDHLIIVKDQTYYLYKNTQNFILIWQEKFDGYISSMKWHEQNVIIEFNDDDHNYDNFFVPELLNIDGDQVRKVKDSSQVLNVYSERKPQALATDTLRSASKSYGSTSLSLSLTDNSPIVWGKTNEGYLKNDLFNIRYKPYNLYSNYSTPHYNEVIDASGNLIIEDAYLERSLLEQASIYILSKSNDKYVYNIQTKDLEKIGFDYILTHDLSYIIGFSRDDTNVKISLMDPYLMTVLDTLSLSVDMYIDHEYMDGKLYIETVKPEEEDLVSFIREASYIEIIEQSFSLVDQNYKEEGIKVYDQVGKKHKQIATLDIDDELQLEFLDTFEIINGHAVMWYKIVQNDTEGYIYRPFTANDDFSYMYSKYYLILEDGTQMEVKIHGDCVHNYIVDHLSQYNYFTTYYGWESPPYGHYYNMNTGETFSTVGYPNANSDGSYFVAYNNGYYEVYSELAIYSMNDQSIETVFFKDFGRWELSAPQWLSETKLQLRAVSADTKVEKKLIIELQDGSWQSSLK